MESFWSRLLWIMAIFSIVFGISLMQLSVYGGVVAMAGAVLMLPPVGRVMGRMMGRLWWAPPIAGFLVATLMGPIITFATAPSLEEMLAGSPQAQPSGAASASK